MGGTIPEEQGGLRLLTAVHETRVEVHSALESVTILASIGVEVKSALESVKILASRSESALSSGERNTSLIENYRT